MVAPLVNRKWKVLKSEQILKLGVWLSVRQEEVQLPSGAVIPSWFILEFPNWINVIAITKDGCVNLAPSQIGLNGPIEVCN